MFKRTKSKTIKLFGYKFSFFGVLKVNRLKVRVNRKSNLVLRNALHNAFASLARQEAARNTTVALYAAVAHFESPDSLELAGKVEVFM